MKEINNLNLEFFKKTDWYKISQYNDCILMKYLQFDCERNSLYKEEVEKSYKIKTLLYFNDEEYFDLGETKEWNPNMNKRFAKNNQIIDEYFYLCDKRCKECVNYSRKINSIIDLDKYTKKELIKIFEGYTLKILKVMPFVNTLTIFENFLTAKLRDSLKQRKIKKSYILKYLLKFSLPIKETFSSKQNRELLKLAKEIQKTKFLKKNRRKINQIKYKDFPEKIRKKIEEHQQKYAWMGIIFMRGKPYSTNKFFEDLKGLLVKNCAKKLDSLIKEKRNKEDNIFNIIKKLRFSKEEKFIVEKLRQIAFMRVYRIDMINISNFYALKFLEYIANKVSLSYKDSLFLMPSEIKESLLDKKNFENDIKIRKKGWAMIIYKDKLELITGEKYNLIKDEVFTKDYSKFDSVKGMVAYKGKVIGKVFIAMNSGQLKGITKEDILIAPETTVDFEIAMEKVKAIVTDRGGILSHAAIVSREMKKPCVIGTKIATKVFKDGDLIEVDANKGIVRKIK